MRDYLKILCSIIASLISLALLASTVSAIAVLISSRFDIYRAVLIPFVFAWVGFVMFGVIGSALWFGFSRVLGMLSIGPMKLQVIAASLSTVASWLTVSVVMSGGKFDALPGTAFLFILVVPVVAISLLWYWYLYQRKKINDARDGDR